MRTTSPATARHATGAQASALVSPLEPQSDRFIATPREWRGTDGLFTFLSFGYMNLCFQWSSGIMNAALVHENDLRSHRTARDRRASQRLGIAS